MAYFTEGDVSSETEEEIIENVFYRNKFKRDSIQSFERLRLGNIFRVFTNRLAVVSGNAFFVSPKQDLENTVIETLHERIISSSAIRDDTIMLASKSQGSSYWAISVQKHIPYHIQKSGERVQYVLMEAAKHHLKNDKSMTMLYISTKLGEELREFYNEH